MGVLKFAITFDNPQKVYHAGGTVSGTVELVLDRPKKHNGVYLQLLGKADVEWIESDSMPDIDGSSMGDSTTYSASEIYFKKDFMLVAGGAAELRCGSHQYPFSYILPTVLPSSFEGGTGYVRYTAQAKVVRPWRFNHLVREAFTVNAVRDLNHDPLARVGVSAENQMYLCCLCCKSGPITVSARLPHSGYAPGETLKVDAEVDNQSNTVMTVSAVLYQVIDFHATKKSTQSTREVGKIRGRLLPVRDMQVWSDEPLHLPPLPPTDLGGGCKIIGLRYKLTVMVAAHQPSLLLDASLPITIGTIPLYEAPLMTEAEPSAPPLPNMPPPTYEECMFGQRDIKERGDSEYEGGNKQFAPRYPIYRSQDP